MWYWEGYNSFLWLHLGSFCSSGLTFFCAPQADPWSLASPPRVVGLRNKIPACWVENIQIFFSPRQRMSRGVGAVRLKMGLSFKDTLTESTKTQSGRLWASWDIVRVSVLHPSATSPPAPPPHNLYLLPCSPPFISRWAHYSPLHACISAFLKWGDLRMPFSFHSSERPSHVTLTFAKLEQRPDQSAIDFVSQIHSKYPPYSQLERSWPTSFFITKMGLVN